MSDNPIERRRGRRRALDIYLNKILGDEPFAARTLDISARGIYVQTLLEPHFWEGKAVTLEFSLPGSSEVIWAAGEIVRQAREDGVEGTGILFTAIADAHRKAIEDFVERGAPDELFDDSGYGS